MLKKDIGADVLYKVCDRIVDRWRGDDHRKLTAEQALEDVVNGKAPAHVEGRRTGRETPHPQGETASRSKDEPRPAWWYVSVMGGTEESWQERIDRGMRHSELVGVA